MAQVPLSVPQVRAVFFRANLGLPPALTDGSSLTLSFISKLRNYTTTKSSVRALFLDATLAGEISSLGRLEFRFSLMCRPFRLDFYRPNFTQRIVPKTTPLPFGGFLHQSALDRIAMQVA